MKFHLLPPLLLLLFIPSCQPGTFSPNPEQPGHRNSITGEGRFAVTVIALLQCSQCSEQWATQTSRTHTRRDSSHHTHCGSQQPWCVRVACPVLRAADVQAICLLLMNPHSLGQSYSKSLVVRARAVGKCNITLQKEKIPVWERDAQSSWIRNRYVVTCLRFRCHCKRMLRSRV